MPKLSAQEIEIEITFDDPLSDVVGWERSEMREMSHAIMVDIEEEAEEMRDGSYRLRRPSEYEVGDF